MQPVVFNELLTRLFGDSPRPQLHLIPLTVLLVNLAGTFQAMPQDVKTSAMESPRQQVIFHQIKTLLGELHIISL